MRGIPGAGSVSRSVDPPHRLPEGVTSLGIGYGTFIPDHTPVRGFLDAEVQWTRNPSDDIHSLVTDCACALVAAYDIPRLRNHTNPARNDHRESHIVCFDFHSARMHLTADDHHAVATCRKRLVAVQ